MAKQKILICGATGFIGRNLIEWLARQPEFEVVAAYNRRPPFEWPNVKWRKADLTDSRDVAAVVKGVDIIIQAAATTSGSKDITTRPYIHITDNAVMNSLIFRAAHDFGVRHVLFFSCAVMLPSSDKALAETDFDANAEIHPSYFGIGWTKLYIEKMCEFYSRLGTTKYTAIRHSNVYGPHDKFDLERSHVFGATITKVMTAKDGEIVVWGSGKEARDLLYVDDLMEFVEAAIARQSTPFALYHCGYGEAVSVYDLVSRIIAGSGRELAIKLDPTKPTINTSLFLDCRKAAQELGWRRKTSLDDGIKRTLAWWQANLAGKIGENG
jgi:nucleoside-diphosphate-sugar epimerase